jgi:outer membrane protein assembly factor BamB
LFCLELETGNEVWSLDLAADSLTEMEQVWHNDSIPSFFRTGVIVGNYSYQFSDTKRKNNLYCVDLETGIPQWVQEMDGRWGNLLAVNDKLMILNSSGKVIIANATPEKYDIVKELQVLTNSNKPDYFCWIAPTFVDGKLFIRNSIGEMACINLGN